MTTSRKERLTELVGLIRDSRQQIENRCAVTFDIDPGSTPSRRHLWQADAVFGGQMASAH